MKCKNCGYQNTEGASYCRSCGAPLSGASLPQKNFPKWIFGLAAIIVILIIAGLVIFLHESNAVDHKSTPRQDETLSAQASSASEDNAAPTLDDLGDPPYPQDDGGIHRYSYEILDCGWNEAFRLAQEAGGYLAHINSEEEFNYIVGEIENKGYHKIQFHIGGRRDGGDQNYYWVDYDDQTYGDSLNNSMGHWFWMIGEPSFECDGAEERYLNIFYYNKQERWVANDEPENSVAQVPKFSGHVGYIVEYDD